MRLTPEHVKAALLHDDRDVRTAALLYFSDSFSRDAGVMPLVIAAIERWGWDQAFEVNSCIQELLQSKESVRWLMDQADRLPIDVEGANNSVVRSALKSADVHALKHHESKLLSLDSLDDDIKKEVVERLSQMDSSPEDLWQQLEEVCHRSDDAHTIPQPLAFGFNLVAALARHREFSTNRVLQLLSPDSDESDKWLEVFGIRLAGELRLLEATPRIVELLQDADDWIFEQGERALIKIGDDAVAEQLSEAFPRSEFGFRICGAFVLRNIHSEASVAASLRLAESEEDQDVKNVLLQAALLNFCTAAIEPARQHVLSVPLDPGVIEVRNDLLTCCKLLGERIPEFDAWTEARKDDQEIRRKWYRSRKIDPLLRAFEDQEVGDDDDSGPLPAPATIMRDEARVGRNDPCPCGSGKKFKRCCLKHRHSVS